MTPSNIFHLNLVACSFDRKPAYYYCFTKNFIDSKWFGNWVQKILL